jgi:hypothetical protein
LSFPVYGQTFEIFTDCSDFAMSAGIRQGDKWLAFFSKKLSPAQHNYPGTDRELLAIVVETLKNFTHMLLGQAITVFSQSTNSTLSMVSRDAPPPWRNSLVCHRQTTLLLAWSRRDYY